MKNIWKVFTFVVFFVFSLTACNQGQSSGIEVEYLWSMADIKNSEKLANEMGGMLLSYDNTLHVKPPFYEGKMPLEFVSTGKQMGGGGGMMGSSLGAVFVYDFGKWRNYFLYNDMSSMLRGMPDGIVAVDGKTKQIIAECKVMDMLTKDNQLIGFKVAENHFNMEGQAIFTSVFEIDFSAGVKSKELETRGTKERDYFFIWPNGMGMF